MHTICYYVNRINPFCTQIEAKNSNYEINVKCKNTQIDSKASVKYLGATLDADLSGTPIAKNAIVKASKGLQFLYRHDIPKLGLSTEK